MGLPIVEQSDKTYVAPPLIITDTPQFPSREELERQRREEYWRKQGEFKPVTYKYSPEYQAQLNQQQAYLAQQEKDAIMYNNALRTVGLSNMTDEQASHNPSAVAENMRNFKLNTALTLGSVVPIVRGFNWLRTASLPAYYGLNAGLTGISTYDWYKNGPSFENVTGTILGLTGLGVEAYPAVRQFVGKQIVPYYVSKEIKAPPISTEEPLLNVGWGPKQTISVSHKSDSGKSLSLLNESRWDVVNEGANPLGIWYQGKLGIPRTIGSGATAEKAAKAEKARKLFANRPYNHTGELTLEKPIITVGDVSNRSNLSWQVEQFGADGIIYNDVYDNGYNNNQVILSFKKPQNQLLTIRGYKGGQRKSDDYEFFSTDPKYARNYGRVRPYYIYSKFPIITKEPLMGYKDPVTMDMFVDRVSNGNQVDAIIGHDKITGEFSYTSKGDEILIFNPNQARLISSNSSKLTEAEIEGIPKGQRNLKIHGHDYSNPTNYGKLYQKKSINPESNQFGKFIDEGSEALVFEDPNNSNMVLKVNTDWRGTLQEFFDRYVVKRNRVPYQKPIILRGVTEEGFPVFNQERVTPMTDEQYFQNLSKIREMLYNKGFVGDFENWGYVSNGSIEIGDFNPRNVGFDSKGNIVFFDIDVYKKGGKL